MLSISISERRLPIIIIKVVHCMPLPVLLCFVTAYALSSLFHIGIVKRECVLCSCVVSANKVADADADPDTDSRATERIVL